MPRQRPKRKVYDDHALAHQTKPTSQIAREFGLNQVYIRQIARGICRPEIHRQILAIRQEAEDEFYAATSRDVRALLEAEVRVALTGPRGQARQCREYLLDTFLPPPKAPSTPGPSRCRPPPCRTSAARWKMPRAAAGICGACSRRC